MVINLNHDESVVTGHNKSVIYNFLFDGCTFFAWFVDTMELCNPKKGLCATFQTSCWKNHTTHMLLLLSFCCCPSVAPGKQYFYWINVLSCGVPKLAQIFCLVLHEAVWWPTVYQIYSGYKLLTCLKIILGLFALLCLVYKIKGQTASFTTQYISELGNLSLTCMPIFFCKVYCIVSSYRAICL